MGLIEGEANGAFVWSFEQGVPRGAEEAWHAVQLRCLESRRMLMVGIPPCIRCISTASYQHHISAVKILLIMARSGLDNTVPRVYHSKAATVGEALWPFQLSLMTPGLRHLVLDLLLDPFDDVRQSCLLSYRRSRSFQLYAVCCREKV